MDRECPLLANNGLSSHVASTSALPLTADIPAPMSALAPISSASPPGADLPDGVAEGPFLTLSGSGDRWMGAQTNAGPDCPKASRGPSDKAVVSVALFDRVSRPLPTNEPAWGFERVYNFPDGFDGWKWSWVPFTGDIPACGWLAGNSELPKRSAAMRWLWSVFRLAARERMPMPC